VATGAGVEPSVMTRFCNEDRGTTTETLDKVCGFLGLELKESKKGRPAARRGVVESA
jgi:hypothetical protein